jgi:hypothetical protein
MLQLRSVIMWLHLKASAIFWREFDIKFGWIKQKIITKLIFQMRTFKIEIINIVNDV